MHTSSFRPLVDFIANGGQTEPLNADAPGFARSLAPLRGTAHSVCCEQVALRLRSDAVSMSFNPSHTPIQHSYLPSPFAFPEIVHTSGLSSFLAIYARRRKLIVPGAN